MSKTVSLQRSMSTASLDNVVKLILASPIFHSSCIFKRRLAAILGSPVAHKAQHNTFPTSQHLIKLQLSV